MKKRVLAAALVAGAVFASQAAAQGSYVGVQLGSADVSGFSGGSVIILTYGEDMPDVTPGFSIEGELTTTLSEPDDRWTSGPASGREKMSYTTVAGYAAYRHPVNEAVSLRARGGLAYHRYEIKENWTNGFGDHFSASYSDSDIKLSLGVGALYQVNPNLSIIGELTRIRSEINHLSAGVQYRF